MRLLFLTPRLPYPPNRGGEIIIFNVLRELSARHEIALVTFYDRPEELPYRAGLEPYCVHLEMVRRRGKFDPLVLLGALGGRSYSISRHLSGEFGAAVRRVVAEWRPDLVQVETFAMSSYIPDLQRLPAVLHMHDVTWAMWERMAGVVPFYLRPLVRIEARRIRRDELAACRAVDVCVPVSAVDARRLAEATASAPVRSTVIVPGVDCEALTPVERSASTSNLVFVGSMSYAPNVDAVEFFARDVLPRIAREAPELTLTIVGARPAAAVHRLAEDPRVRVTGRVDDVRPYYAAAAAAVVPLRIAGGVRMKILEALALGSPLVSTAIGAEGLGLEDGRELLIADTPQEFADAVIRVLRDGGLRDQLAARGRETAIRRFSWQSVVRTLEGVHASAVSRNASQASDR
jgi:sugar transferase (PEP-CTERM/EpsH1 system associated)